MCDRNWIVRSACTIHVALSGSEWLCCRTVVIGQTSAAPSFVGHANNAMILFDFGGENNSVATSNTMDQQDTYY